MRWLTVKGSGFSLVSVYPGEPLTSIWLLNPFLTHPADGPTALPNCSQEDGAGLFAFSF